MIGRVIDMTTHNDTPEQDAGRYAATMAAYASSARSLLARLDGCPCGASAPSDAVKSASRQPTNPTDSKEGNET